MRMHEPGGGFSGGSRGARTFGSAEHADGADRCADPEFDDATGRSRVHRPGWSPSWLVWRPRIWPRTTRRNCCRLPRCGSVRSVVRTRIFRRHGGLRLDHRSALPSRPGRDRSQAHLRLVAAAQCAGACLCGGASCEGAQGWRSRRNVGRPAAAPPAGEPLTIAKSDYDAFERLLGDIQAAYSTEDLSALRVKVTPEMLSYFSEQLAGNASRGLVNRVTDVKLLRGDLAEAWREGGTDYATVAMKFALNDSMVERSSRSGASSRAASGARSPNCGPSCGPVAAIGCSPPSSRLDARHNASASRMTLICGADCCGEQN